MNKNLKPAGAVAATLDHLEEEYLMAALSLEDVEFLCLSMDELYGGGPVLGSDQEMATYIVISTCGCSDCAKFREGYTPVASLTPTRAFRHYAMARMAYSKPINKSLH